jgi:hypothetical protein
MKRLLIIVFVLLALGGVYVLFLGWENFSFIWMQIPYNTSGHSRKAEPAQFRDDFAKAGFSPTSPMQMPVPPRTDIAIRSGTNSSDRKLVDTLSGTFANKYLCYAWLYDDPSRKEYILLVTGPGRLSWLQSRTFRPAWIQLKTSLGRDLSKRSQNTVN